MAKQQSPEQVAEFQRLCRENGLDPKADVWQQPQSGTWIISRTGIEKIQHKNNISVAFEMVTCQPDFACVKATASRVLEGKGAVAKKLVVESFGSALPGNCKVNYYAEMAEKRALSRSVLKNMGFYALGVYGEDEADDFKQGAPAAVAAAKSQAAPPAAAPSATPTLSVASGANGEPAPRPKADWTNEQIKEALDACQVLSEVAKLFNELSPAAQEVLKPFFTAAKTRIQTPAAQPEEQLVAPPVVYATAGQKEDIVRLLNHVATPRSEKTKVLLTINRLTKEPTEGHRDAPAVMARLQASIEAHEKGGPFSITENLRTQLRAFARDYAEHLGLPESDRLTALADNDAIDANELRAEFNAAQESLSEAQAA